MDDEDLRAALLSLDPRQQAAVEALAGGATHATAAEAAGVAREVVTRWVGHHPGVREALNLYRLTMHHERMDRLRSIHDRALAVLDESLRAGATLADALSVLKALPLAIEPAPAAPSAADLLGAELSRAEEVAQREEVPNRDDMSTLLDELSGENVRRRKATALQRVGVAAGVVEHPGN